jgi:AcrR family transcriptional regulator
MSNPRLGKQHLLETAEQLFTEHGYQAVSIRDIAKASGVSNAALYYHFPSKEVLFDEVLEYHADKLAKRMEQAGAQASDTRTKLRAILMEYANQVSERRSPIFSLRRKPDKMNHEQVKKQHRRMVQHLLAPVENTLQAAINQGELQPLATDYSPASLLVGLFHGMLQHQRNINEAEVSPDDIELIIDIFWDGLGMKDN